MSEDVKRMADLLKSGATMLSDVCPVCGTPLFKVEGDVFCAKCNKPVVYQKAMSPQATLSPAYLLDSVEMTIVGKISEANEVLKVEKDPEKLSIYSNLVFGWLSMLEKLRGLKDSIKNDFPSLIQTRSMGFDCAALTTRYPSLRKISLILYSSLLPVS